MISGRLKIRLVNILVKIRIYIILEKIFVRKNRFRYFGSYLVWNRDYYKPIMRTNLLLGTYEKAECTFIREYISGMNPVIELGSSMGVTTSVISRKNPPRIYCVEANKFFAPQISSNIQENNYEKFEIISRAYSTLDKVFFLIGEENTVGSVCSGSSENSIEIEGISLNKLLRKVEGNFELVLDIEGSEVELLIEESDALVNCSLMIIEVHKTEYKNVVYGVDEIRGLIEKLNFCEIKRRDNVSVYRRNI